MKHHREFTIAIDFDDTIADTTFPQINGLKHQADIYINKLYSEGFNIIINTCRSGKYEGQVQEFLDKYGINYHYINSNLPESIAYYKQDCRKISADLYVDDKCLMGIPDTWKEIYDIIKEKSKKYYEYNSN